MVRPLLLALALGAALAAPVAAQRYAKLAPYPALRYVDGKPEIEHDGQWCALTAIDGVAVRDILAHCKKAHPRKWQDRFAEDLVQVMSEMGKPPGETVDLGLIDLRTGKPFVARRVPMTEENRDGVRRTWEHGGVDRRARPGRVEVRADGPSVSPFRTMRDVDGSLHVQVDDDRWYEWVSLGGVRAREIRAWTKRNLGGLWWKRITEDLPAVLDAMGHRAGARVDLELRDLASGEVVKMRGVEMTHAKRQRLWAANNGRGDRPAAPARLTAAKVAEDLAHLRELLDRRFAYRHLRGVDVDSAFAAAREAIGGERSIETRAFALAVDSIIARFGDGHAGVRGSAGLLDPGYLPFLIGEAKGGLVAFDPSRTGLVDQGHPFVVALDGRGIEDWIATARGLVNRGSPQYERSRAIRTLRAVQHVRRMMDLSRRASLEVTLADASGERLVRELAVRPRRPIYGSWPKRGTRVLDGDIGYLRIAEMDGGAEFLAALDAAMARFRATKSLVVDVRGNGGGTRHALRRLFPYLMARDDRPHVASVAAYRLQPGEDDPHRAEGYLANRFMYPANWPGWSDAARDAIAAAARAFEPRWKPPARDFSGWHYLVLDRTDNPRAFHYDRPVIVLLDGGCFSATDVFLGALKGWRGVTLLGTPSGGGSARSQTYRLRNSGIALRLATMASFRPGGELYDGAGVRPDVVVLPRPGYFVGQSDAQLDAAIARLRR